MIAAPSHLRKYYRPELDALRFYAFFLVFLNHVLPSAGNTRIDAFAQGFAPLLYNFVNACRFGLSLFFTLSAFLICELLTREKQATGTVRTGQFYIRRILRIWPLYYFGLALGIVFCFLPGHAFDSVAKLGWYAVFLASWSTVHFGWIDNPVYPLWSVSIEEQFYLFVPLFVRYLGRRLILALCVIIIVAANSYLFCLGRLRANDDSVWPNSFVQFECFAAGMLLSLLLRGRQPRLALWQRLLLFAGSWPCWILAWRAQSHSQNAFNANADGWLLIASYALASLGSLMVLVAFLGSRPKLIPGWAIYLGRISFGLYVFHAFAIESVRAVLPRGAQTAPISALRIVMAFGATVLMAALSYRYLETPFLKMKKRHTVIESRPV